jgi:selenobiotic family peptide radical SAM maturase
MTELKKVFPACRSIIDSNIWNRIVEACGARPDLLNTFPEILSSHISDFDLPKYLPDLARLEKTLHEVKTSKNEVILNVDKIEINPTVQLVDLAWKNLSILLDTENVSSRLRPEPSKEFVLIWVDPKNRKTKYKIASNEDLFVIKIMAEGLDLEEVAAQGALSVGSVYSAIDRSTEAGLLVRPPSRIRRDPNSFPIPQDTEEKFLSSPSFSIQWHITQACDLHCKHCYDRSSRSFLKKEQAIKILDGLQDFCRNNYVKGHVIFTGGNPLLYPNFSELYQAAADRGFVTALLGNPASKREIEDLIIIQRPNFFQVSLEGLRPHNDMIRGDGHFNRVINFLKILRDLGVYSMIMLTLTSDNIDQVLPLADMLRDKTDSFFFNRLSMVGEGANLQLPTRTEYTDFLKSYMDAAEDNPIMGLKDNLFNIVLHQRGMPLFSGCTGFGCGAAFSFVTILSDGEVHACRKFPSPIGNVFQQSMAEIYDSDMAQRYREGCKGCRSCRLRPVCGGCLAITHSYSLNIFEERDPHCFMTC